MSWDIFQEFLRVFFSQSSDAFSGQNGSCFEIPVSKVNPFPRCFSLGRYKFAISDQSKMILRNMEFEVK